MLRFLKAIVLPVLFWGTLQAAPPKECTDNRAACVKANNCAKTPNSAECKKCGTEYEKCVASAPAERATKKAPPHPTR
jgi:hypothetical protein